MTWFPRPSPLLASCTPSAGPRLPYSGVFDLDLEPTFCTAPADAWLVGWLARVSLSLRSGCLPWPNLSLRCNLWALPACLLGAPETAKAFALFVPFMIYQSFWPSPRSFNPSLFADCAASLLWTTQFFCRVAWRSPTTDSTICFHVQGSGVLSAALYSSPAARRCTSTAPLNTYRAS